MSRPLDLFRAFDLMPTVAVWRFEVDGPVRTSDPVDIQVDAILRHAYLAECNETMARMYGQSDAAAAIGTRLASVMPDVPQNRQMLRKFVEGGYLLSNEDSYEVDSQGRPKVFINNFVGLVKDGQLVGALGTQLDATDQRRVQEYERMLGAATAALASSPEYESTLADAAAAVVPRFAESSAVHFVADGTLQSVAAAGDERLLPAPQRILDVVAAGTALADDRLIIVPLRAGGRIFGTMTFAAAAQGRCFDQEDRAFAAQLAGHVALASDHARLFRDLQQASRVKDEFLATLSHELRTPLNAVLGWTRMLRRGTVPPERTAAVLDTIERNAAAQMQLIEEMLDLSAMVAGGLRLNVTRVDVRELVGGAVETIRPAAEGKSVTITLSIEPEARELVGDPGRLRQVLWNLLANSVKFTPPGGTIGITVSRGPADVEFRVTDTGRGITADFLPHVFEPFRQGDASATRQVGGLGLGLAIVRHIVEAHGGTVSVASDGLDRGSTFSVHLPATRTAAGADADGVARLRGRRVLAVDDDESMQEIVATMLLMYGVSVRTAGRAAQAFEILSSWRPDVLLADLAMPGEDGFALVRRVRALPPPLGSIPAVALTAYVDPQSVQNAFAAGFDAHLGKPLEPHVLADALTKVLRARH